MTPSFTYLVAAVSHCHTCRRGKWSFIYTESGSLVIEDTRRHCAEPKLCISVSPAGRVEIESFQPILPSRAGRALTSSR